MAFNDPVAELLTKIRNAKSAQHRFVDISHSKLKVKILDLLKKHHFIDNFLVSEERRAIRVFLRYNATRESVIHGLRRMSTGGRRRYLGYDDIPRILNGMGIVVLSTPQGVMDGEEARSKHLGGEYLCAVW